MANAVVIDPDDFANRERLRQIYDARQEFQEARQNAQQLRAKEGWSLHEKQDYVLRAFQRYFFEVEGLMERHPEGDHYLEEVELGAVLPPEAQDGERNGDNHPEARVFVGLRSLAHGYRPMPTPGWKNRSGQDTRAIDTEVQVTVPETTVTKAFRAVNKFLAEVGLDADMDEETRDAGFDYSDILQEGPPGGSAPELEADGGATDGGNGE
jgi:hypothetical protein